MALETPASQGLITQAMSLRVKYRQVDSDGKIVRKKVHLQASGVHPMNRGGMFPSGIRCRSLCEDVISIGFAKEEVLHNFVAVEETPVAHVRSRGDKYVSGLEYNIEKSSKDELLCTCFSPPYNEVRHLLLGHNHLMLVVRGVCTKATWNLPSGKVKAACGITFCDDKGRLSLDALAGHPNGKQLKELLDEGADCEILSWKMDVEEPQAASLISQALNTGSEIALRTTELTAVAVLKGEIILQMTKDVSQRVAFNSVRDRVRQELNNAADDPDLPELFDFLISLGVGKNSYVEDMLEFAGCFVDSKKRQLRFSAFSVPNKMFQSCPWAKVAVIKRSYRKKPVSGFCPNPESQWTSVEEVRLQLLEGLLRFFHVDLTDLVGKLEPQSRQKLLGNIDVAAADAFFTQASKKQKVSIKTLQNALRESTHEYATQLGVQKTHVPATMPWIDFTGDTPATEAAVAAGTKLCSAAEIIVFDEKSGAVQNQQRAFEEVKKQKTKENYGLPWREWLSDKSLMGATDADKGAVVTALHALHERFKISDQKIDVVLVDGQVRVVATEAVQVGEVLLPPCVLKPARIVEVTDHLHAVKLTVTVTRATDEEKTKKEEEEEEEEAQKKKKKQEEAQKKNGTNVADKQKETSAVLRTKEFFVLPEFKHPKKKESTAVADSTKAAVADPVWMWGEGGEDSMHPFWAVRRMTAAQLKLEQINPVDGKPTIRFNCEMTTRTMNAVCIGAGLGTDTSVTRTRVIEAPFLSNSHDIVKGEELVLEVKEKKKKPPPVNKRSWRDVEKDNERQASAAGTKTKAR